MEVLEHVVRPNIFGRVTYAASPTPYHVKGANIVIGNESLENTSRSK